ncbi:hypothetical protein LCGC14_2563920 [marine sediment metagenome]|uniref:Uncharacterized protein n=1 Tax=marine sediment metagenome TaxID=412755 RepID=A0A0F9CVE7_9ZZZZ
MPIGLVIMRWDIKVSTEILAKYPDELVITEETLMQIYAAHEYTGEPGMVSLMVGPLNIASYYTGREKPLYIMLLLNLDEDADAYEGGLSDISRVIFQNFEDNAYLEMIPFLFQRLSTYPHLNEEQSLAISYLDNVNRLILNRLREEGVISKSELKIWLKDQYREGFFDVDAILMELIKKEIIKEASVKGMPSELIFLINDLFMIRRPPINLLKNPSDRGLPEKFVDEYNITVKNFFQKYRPSEEDSLKLLEEVIADPQVYEILKLLRISIVTKNVLEKLRKKGVDDIDGGLKKLWDNQMIHVFQDARGNEYYALLTDFHSSLMYPKYMINIIIQQYAVKSKSNAVLIEYLNVLDDLYRHTKLTAEIEEE